MAIKIKGQVVIDDNQNIVSSGEAIATNFKTGTTNVHNSGIEVSGINVLGGDTPIGSEALIYDNGNASFVNVNATNITATGSATFAGGVIHGQLTAGGTGGNYLSNGEVAAYGPSTSANLWRGWNASGGSNVLTSSISAIGSAMFANDITLDRATAPSDVKISGSDTHAVWLSDGKFALKYDGSATFAGGVELAYSQAIVPSDQTDANWNAFSVINSGGSTTSTIKGDGSVWFARGNFQMDTAGVIQTNLYSAGTLNIDSSGSFSSPKIVLNAANGNATFAGTIDAAGFTVNGAALSSGGSSDASTLAGMSPSTVSTGDTIAQRDNNGSLSMTYAYTSWVRARTDINSAFDPAAFVVMSDGWYYHLNKADMKSALDVGFIPQNYVDTAYTLTADDKGKHIKSSGQNVTVPSGVFSTGDVVTIYNYSFGSATLNQGSGVTMYHAGSNGSTGNRSLANFALATILCTGSNEFVVSGTGVS